MVLLLVDLDLVSFAVPKDKMLDDALDYLEKRQVCLNSAVKLK